jgi:NAD(P)H-hydrate epimerase
VRGLALEGDAREVFGLVGPGNNGGDTLVALSHLAADGWRARAYLIRRQADALSLRFERAGGEVILRDQDPESAGFEVFLQTAAIVLDGVLGTGSKPPLRGDAARVLAAVKRALASAQDRPFVVAVDCPSGVNCDTGEIDECSVAADLTISMAAVKRGLLMMPAYELVGELKIVDIGVPPSLPALQSVNVEVAEGDAVAGLMPSRPVDAHKGTFGTALIVAGSVNYTGAAWLAGKAAYRVGVGLVTLAVPTPVQAALAGQLPEATWIALPNSKGAISGRAAELVAASLARSTAILIGPGIGAARATAEFLLTLLSEPRAKVSSRRPADPRRRATYLKLASPSSHWPPTVVDADGLRLLVGMKRWHRLLRRPAILTPHPGEMEVLTGISKAEIQQNREAIARKFALEWGHVVVLKGAFTVVASPEGRMTVVPIASAALARAGTGDVLAGVIVGLLAQGVEAYDAAVAATWIHGQAGILASIKIGSTASVLAGDVLASIPEVIADLPRQEIGRRS